MNETDKNDKATTTWCCILLIMMFLCLWPSKYVEVQDTKNHISYYDRRCVSRVLLWTSVNTGCHCYWTQVFMINWWPEPSVIMCRHPAFSVTLAPGWLRVCRAHVQLYHDHPVAAEIAIFKSPCMYSRYTTNNKLVPSKSIARFNSSIKDNAG